MKPRRFWLIALFLALCSLSIEAQLRFDLGVDIPRGVGALVGSDLQSAGFDGLANAFFPFPEASVYYTFGEATVKGGVGLRAFTLIVESLAWPNAFVELALGPVVVEAQIGGGLFAIAGLANDIQFGKIFFPDLSAWLRIGKSFRLGLGALGLFVPGVDLANTLPFVWYLGAKFTIAP